MPDHRPTLISSIRSWWSEQRRTNGVFPSAGKLFALAYEFLRNSLPDRKRQRYGDMDYDWEFRVDTTSANVSWQSRLLGLLNSAYQPIEPELLRQIIDSLKIAFAEFTFIDIGSGKGRALLIAAEYPFRRVCGIELLPELDAIAQENIRKFLSQGRALTTRAQTIDTSCGDATDFTFPDVPAVVLLNNPLPEYGLRKLAGNLEKSLEQRPRPVFVIYANAILEEVFESSPAFRKIRGTHQYSLFFTGGHTTSGRQPLH